MLISSLQNSPVNQAGFHLIFGFSLVIFSDLFDKYAGPIYRGECVGFKLSRSRRSKETLVGGGTDFLMMAFGFAHLEPGSALGFSLLNESCCGLTLR